MGSLSKYDSYYGGGGGTKVEFRRMAESKVAKLPEFNITVIFDPFLYILKPRKRLRGWNRMKIK